MIVLGIDESLFYHPIYCVYSFYFQFYCSSIKIYRKNSGTKPKTVYVGESYVSHGLVASDGRLMLDLETLILPTGAMRPEAFVRACYGLSDQPDSAPEYLRCVRLAQYHLDDGNLVEPFQVSLPKLVD